MISFKHSGGFDNLERLMGKFQVYDYVYILNSLGKKGVEALSAATPVDSSLTSKSWSYDFEKTKTSLVMRWYNSNVVNGVPIAIILQYGHGTGNGGYVEGRDYINPAIQPIFDEIAMAVWKEVLNNE